MAEDEEICDPYEKEQKRLRDLYEDVSTDEDVEDPYADSTGEYGSDENYVPSEQSGSSTTPSDESEMSDLEEQTSSTVRTAKKYKTGVIQQGTLAQSTGVTQTKDTLQNVVNYILDHHEESDEGITQQTLEHQEGLDDDIARQAPEQENVPELDDLAWEEVTTDIPDFNFNEATNRLKVDINPNASPQDVFECLFTETIMKFVVNCTNSYGETLAATNRPKTKNSRDAKFRPVTSGEMKKFFALCLLQGQISTSNMRRFFSYADVLYFHPIFSYVMSGRRFEQILRILYCSTTFTKKKEKVEPFLNLLIAQFQSVYGPTKQLSLDESLLHFRGRLGFRVYIKNKKAKYGIKFYELTTSDGYLLNTEMYSGTIENQDEDSTKLESLVLRLMRPYLMQGHELFMDNFYNSYRLSEKLLALRTHTNGTLRSNRKGNPLELVKKKLKKGDHFWVRRKQVYVSKWRDKRDVLVITTRNHPRLVLTRNRYGKEMTKPEEIVEYNRHMSGIDRCDQMTATYSTPRKTIRWYKKVIFHMLDVTIWNAFYLYKKYCKNNTKSCRFLDFRDSLIKSFLKLPDNIEGKHLIRPKKHDNRRQENVLYELEASTSQNLLEGHWPERITGEPSAKSNKKKVFLKCRKCTKKGLRKETAYRCKGCLNTPPLCPECFEEWHGSTAK